MTMAREYIALCFRDLDQVARLMELEGHMIVGYSVFLK